MDRGKQRLRVVVIGGGTGIYSALLGLKNLLEEAEHVAVVRHHQGGEAFDAVDDGNSDQILEEEASQAVALPLVLAGERGLGQVSGGIALVAGHGDYLL